MTHDLGTAAQRLGVGAASPTSDAPPAPSEPSESSPLPQHAPRASAVDASADSQALLSPLLRADLVGRTAYGAPQLDVPVALNTNENAYPVPKEVADDIVAAVAAVVPGLNRYPDREFTALRQDLAAYLTRATGTPLSPEQIWAANGSNEVLLHLLQAFGGPGRVALGFTPAYSMHPVITCTTGTRWIDGERGDGRPASRAGGRRHDPIDPIDPIDQIDPTAFDLVVENVVRQVRTHNPHLVFLCSPNNPTGTAIGLDLVCAVYEAAPHALIVVDEAYAEFARPGTPSATTLLAGRPRLVVSRTMSKAFALAGGRLGYLAADPVLVDALRLVRMPYHLASTTQAVARAALAHADTLLDTVEVIKAQRDRIVTQVAELGLSAVASDANFVLVGGFDDAHASWQALLDAGVLVRDVGIAGHLRITAGTPAETGTLLRALADHVKTRPPAVMRPAGAPPQDDGARQPAGPVGSPAIDTPVQEPQ